MHAVHVSPYVGTWYPDCRTDLERLLDDLFETSAQRTGAFLFANPLGFVVPHAGLQYSGAVAAAAYRSDLTSSACSMTCSKLPRNEPAPFSSRTRWGLWCRMPDCSIPAP